MISSAFALPFLLQAPAGGGGSSLTPLAFQFVLIVAIIYFVMWRPQQKQRKQHESSLAARMRGEQVVTAGGIIWEVVFIRETSKDGGTNRLDDQVTIRSGETKIIIERGRIAKITNSTNSSSATNTTST